MDDRGYWHRTLQHRISRRRALQLAALTGGGAALAAACGGGGEEAPKGATPSVSGQPVVGGEVTSAFVDVFGLDPHLQTTFTTHVAASWPYSRLMRFASQAGQLPLERWYEPVPELAEKVESPDATTFIFHLNPEAKWHAVPPTNGRPVVAEDVVYAWQRYSEKSPNKNNFSMVDSVTASPDGKTVTFKLKQPFGLFLNRVASYQDLWIMPRELIEADGDGNKRMVGSGPFIFEGYDRSVAMKFRKNPDYFEKDQYGNRYPYFDRLNLPIIADKNAEITQFVAGNLATISVPAPLLSAFKQQAPNAVVNSAMRNLLNFLYFEPASFTENKKPFGDDRVRRALSMAIDRDTLLKVASPEGGEWPNVINAGLGERWWLDPRGPDIGEAGKWYKFDLAEAKKLLSAAGFADGFSTRLHFSANIYVIVVPYYNAVAEALPAMLREVGINVESVPEDYLGQYFSQTFSQGNFDGMAWGLMTVFSDVAAYVANMFLPRDEGGGRNMSRVDDSALADKVRSFLAETDAEAIREKLFDIERYASDKMYYIPGITPTEFGARQPWIKNAQNEGGPTTYGLGTEGTMWVWVEKT